MRLLINEWFIHDLGGDNGLEAQEESARFLISLIKGSDQIVVLEDSPWMGKAFKLMKETDETVRRLSKLLMGSVILDSNKCQRLKISELKSLPEELQKLLDERQVDSDDYYLLQTYYSTDIDFLITSDARLRDALSQIPEIKIVLRNDFLRPYLE